MIGIHLCSVLGVEQMVVILAGRGAVGCEGEEEIHSIVNKAERGEYLCSPSSCGLQSCHPKVPCHAVQAVPSFSLVSIASPYSANDDKKLGQGSYQTLSLLGISRPRLRKLEMIDIRKVVIRLQDSNHGFHQLHVKSGQCRPDLTVRLQLSETVLQELTIEWLG
jgi:hypothetical protein